MGKWLLKFEIIRGVWHVMSWVFYWACQSLCLKRQSSCTREDIIISYQVALCSLFLVLILAMHSRCRSAEPKVENVTCCVRAKQCCSCRPSPSRIHWKFNTSGSASQTCVILLQKEQLLHYMSPRREFFFYFFGKSDCCVSFWCQAGSGLVRSLFSPFIQPPSLPTCSGPLPFWKWADRERERKSKGG